MDKDHEFLLEEQLAATYFIITILVYILAALTSPYVYILAALLTIHAVGNFIHFIRSLIGYFRQSSSGS